MIHKTMLRNLAKNRSVFELTPIVGGRQLLNSSLTSQRQKSLSAEDVPSVNGKKLTPQEAKMEAAKLAMNSLKDMGSLFSSGNDDAMQPIDSTPVFENHELFGSLNVIHQGQVGKELQDKYDKKWTKMTLNEKKLGYYVAYGNWGVREKFDKWDTLEAPWDLPFTLPPKVQTTNPEPSTKVKKLEPVFLAETEVRKEQFDTKKMDPVTKTFIYLTLLIAMLALARDKNVGEEGKPVEQITVDRYAEEREAEEQREVERLMEEKLAEERARRRKWYYLWLK